MLLGTFNTFTIYASLEIKSSLSKKILTVLSAEFLLQIEMLIMIDSNADGISFNLSTEYTASDTFVLVTTFGFANLLKSLGLLLYYYIYL